jgi:methyl-accepting chemotaxis protein
MNLLQNLRLGRRMAVGFGSLLALLVIVTAIAIANFRSTSAVLDQLLGTDLVKSQAVAHLETATRANATRSMELLLTEDAARQASLRERIATNRKLAGEAIATLERLVELPEAKARLAEVLTLRGRYVAAFERVDGDLTKGLRDEARERAQGEVVPLLEQLITAVKSLDQLMQQLTARCAPASTRPCTGWPASAPPPWCWAW